jgi:hypothetical protein
MTSIVPEVDKCPRCSKKIWHLVTCSYSNFGDDMQNMPKDPEWIKRLQLHTSHPPLHTCPYCKEYIWIDELVRDEEVENPNSTYKQPPMSRHRRLGSVDWDQRNDILKVKPWRNKDEERLIKEYFKKLDEYDEFCKSLRESRLNELKKARLSDE